MVEVTWLERVAANPSAMSSRIRAVLALRRSVRFSWAMRMVATPSVSASPDSSLSRRSAASRAVP